ncbi:amidase family protein [Pengzhenrongella sicca]|uniref:Amidase domain-containing protein n=1 Tax=Pengzhenrongella sicca TaxID=2819238 RepID=A0A8A4ZCL6_9MICO|nr:amidase family protein [Pengzhenrongella sicca]QTE28237.1 hypothetical protein J4E96_12660 [Pengzhenrongella sicca]
MPEARNARAAVGPIWRVLGDPLVRGAGAGPLAGQAVAVKDLFDVAGHRVGAGVPAYLAGAAPATAHAYAVGALLAAGADVRGIAQTDEFAYSIAGRNPHSGTPANGAVPGALPGGSSSGPATAVALRQASIGLGTDTGGSIRVPASYQGLWGLRSTHGAVPVGGLVPLAPAFDAVGWLARDGGTLRAAVAATLVAGEQRAAPARYAVAPDAVALADPGVGAAFGAALARLGAAGLLGDLAVVDTGDLDELAEAFRTVQAAQAWRVHGAWVRAHPGALGDDVAARFAWARSVTADAAAAAGETLAAARARLEALLGERTLLLPSASSAAPPVDVAGGELDLVRARTMRLTCLAGITGRPALSVPVLSVPVLSVPGGGGHNGGGGSSPVGLCLVGPRCADLALIDMGRRLAAALDLARTATARTDDGTP